MHAAIVEQWGEAPKYTKVEDLPAPNPARDEIRVRIEAVGLHNVVRSRASGRHYSSVSLPHKPGVDGFGTTEDGKKVYFASMQDGATFADEINIGRRNVIPAPEGTDIIQAAALINPGMSAWTSYKLRAKDLPKDFTVLIVGATSASGQLAVHFGRFLGAKRIIAAARGVEALKKLDVDEIIAINSEDPKKTDFSSVGDVDVIIDYVMGPVSTHLLTSLKSSRPVQYIHSGSLSAEADFTFPLAVLRSKDLTIRGNGIGAYSPQQLRAELPALLNALKDAPKQAVKAVPLSEVEKVWGEKSSERVVFMPGA